MYLLIIFMLGYAFIALEHYLPGRLKGLDKAAPAVIMAAIMWAVYALGTGDLHHVEHEINHHAPDIFHILFFLLGAMTIVETIDINDGFHVITSRITSRRIPTLLAVITVITFFLSAGLDNLTTTIVMASILSKLLPGKENRLLRWTFGGMIVIAANAGGAWSPIGDVTTTMLWIGGQVTTGSLITRLILPSIVCAAVPLGILMYQYRGKILPALEYTPHYKTTAGERVTLLIVGIACLLFVPVFKSITHLPPYMGMLFGVGVMWTLSHVLHHAKPMDKKSQLSIYRSLEKIDVPAVLFFWGILSAVAVLASMGTLKGMAGWLSSTIPNADIVVLIIGALSSVVDNVPLVAAAMNMYDIDPESLLYMTDGKFWEFLAYAAGTGGSLLIIGSAAGVAIMGIEKIDFVWYLKRFSLLAFLGYIAGAITYLVLYIP